MQQNDASSSSSSYYQYYQSHFHNPNPNPAGDHPNSNTTPTAATYASAPPVSDYFSSNYSVPRSYDQSQFAPPVYDYSNPAYDPNLTPPSSYYPYNRRSDRTAGSIGDGIYAYNEGRVELSTGLGFDDYGRPINFPSGNGANGSGKLSEVMKAVPKMDMQPDVNSGIQKFRVRLLAEGGAETDADVLCQIGLDGIRIVDAATSRTLKIYPLETVIRWEVLDSIIFAFWAKNPIDIEARRTRLMSNSYTTNNILDTVAAATIQLKEMGGSEKISDPLKVSEQLSEKNKRFPEWMNLMKPGNEEKDHWVPDEATTKCTACSTDFGAFVRRHHCRNCGDIFCDKCTQGRITLTADDHAQPVRVCDQCMAEVTQRLTNANEMTVRVSGKQSHKDLAKKLQEEMTKNRNTLTGVNSNGSGVGMREVECPACTVHLQVQIPTSGSITAECSVCQNPFLVSSH